MPSILTVSFLILCWAIYGMVAATTYYFTDCFWTKFDPMDIYDHDEDD